MYSSDFMPDKTIYRHLVFTQVFWLFSQFYQHILVHGHQIHRNVANQKIKSTSSIEITTQRN